MAEAQALLADRYRLVREVGRGGMGVVWEAWDERLERPVAVKELRPQPGLSPEEAELAKDRAMREARITARLHHRNAVPVFDVVEHAGTALPRHAVRAVGPALGACSARAVRWAWRETARSAPRWPRRWPPPTSSASCTATSSPATSSSPTTAPR